MKSLKKTGRNHEIFQKIFELRLQVKSILSARGFLAKQKKNSGTQDGYFAKEHCYVLYSFIGITVANHLSKFVVTHDFLFRPLLPLKTTCNGGKSSQ